MLQVARILDQSNLPPSITDLKRKKYTSQLGHPAYVTQIAAIQPFYVYGSLFKALYTAIENLRARFPQAEAIALEQATAAKFLT